MNSNVNLVEIFYFTDEFCKEFSKMVRGHQLKLKASPKTATDKNRENR